MGAGINWRDQRRLKTLKGKDLEKDAKQTILAIRQALSEPDLPVAVLNALRMALLTLRDLRRPQRRPNAKKVISDDDFKKWYSEFRTPKCSKTKAVELTSEKLGISRTAVWNRLKTLNLH